MRQLRIPTTLKVVNGLDTVTPTTRMPSDAAQTARQNLANAVRLWATLGDLNQQNWNRAAGVWGPKMGLPTDGFSVFKSLALTQMVAGLPVTVTASDVPDPIPPTPKFELAASLSSQGAFTLNMTIETPAEGLFLITASPSQTLGTSRFSLKQARNLTVLNGLPAVSHLSAEFTEAFLTPSAFTKILVTLTPLTPRGFRGTTRSQYCVVQPPPGLSVTE